MLVAHIAQGFDAYCAAVGYDGRVSGPDLEPPLVEGLKASGVDVIRIGRGPTPMLYFAATLLKTDGAVMHFCQVAFAGDREFV